jgi:hypothetical protein
MNARTLTYPVGTLYSNSEIYDQATDEVVHGWQVFKQLRPDGTPTGRKSFINHRGNLCGVEVAERMRQRAPADCASELLASLKAMLAAMDDGSDEPTLVAARAVALKAGGIE